MVLLWNYTEELPILEILNFEIAKVHIFFQKKIFYKKFFHYLCLS